MQVPKFPRQLTLSLSMTAILLSLASPTAAQDCARLTATWPRGPADAVFTAQGRSYFGSGTVLVIGDVSDILNPRVAGSIDLGMLIGDIVADRTTVIVAAGSFDGSPGAVITVDVSDPAGPEISSQLSTPFPALSVAQANGIAYVGLVDPLEPSAGRLLAIDLLRPESPVTIALPGWPEELNIDGVRLWITELGTGARAFDITDPLSPTEVAFVAGNVRDLDAVGDILYLAEWGDDRHDALRIIDVSDPASLDELARYDATRPRKVEVFGQAAYMLSAPSEKSVRLEVIDVSLPGDPDRLGVLSIGGGGGDLLIHDLAVTARIVYLTHSQGGPVVVNAVDATEPRVAAIFDTPGLALSFAADEHLLAVATGSSGLAVADLAANGADLPTAPDPPLPFAQDVALANGYAFVAGWAHGIRVYDLSDPGMPVEVAVVETGYSFFRTVISGHHLYASFLGSPHVRTAIFDISDPLHPMELAELPGGVLAVDRGHAYADWSDWLGRCALATWDVSDPANPGPDPSRINFWGGCARCDWPWPDYSRSYELDPHRSISGISIHGNLAWVALGQGGVKVLSLANPSSPTQVSTFDVNACGVTGVAAERGTAYVATHTPSGLLAVRMDEDGEVTQSAFVALAGFPADAVLSGKTVYTANQTAGVSAIDVTDCRSPVRATGRRAP